MSGKSESKEEAKTATSSPPAAAVEEALKAVKLASLPDEFPPLDADQCVAQLLGKAPPDEKQTCREVFCLYVHHGRLDDVCRLFEQLTTKYGAAGREACVQLATMSGVYNLWYIPPLALAALAPIEGWAPEKLSLNMPEERARRVKLLGVLMEHGANPNDECYYGRTCLANAQQSGMLEMMPIAGLDTEFEAIVAAKGQFPTGKRHE